MADKVVEQATGKLEVAIRHWKDIYDQGEADLDFLSDEPGAQWHEGDYQKRIADRRPALTIDQLEQFVNQVTNDIKMNTPTINVIPADGAATPKMAEIYKGMLRDIQHRTNADTAYDTAVGFSVEASIGYFRITHDYVAADGFEQGLQFKRVINPFLVYLDPDSIELDGSDARHGFVLEPMTKEKFAARWPKRQPVGISCSGIPEFKEEDEQFYVAEYFRVEESRVTLYLLRDGTQGEVEGELDPASMEDVVVTRPSMRQVVKHCWMSGKEILDETTFPGRYVPIVPVYGKEVWRKGKRHLRSLHRKAKDAQRMFNYWKSTEAYLLMKQPNAPVIAARGTIDDYMDDYRDPQNQQVLLYEPYDEQNRQLPPPQIGNPPPIPVGVVNAARESVDDIKATMGLYNAFLGQRSNEVSGRAINARKLEGDRAVYHFGNNLLASIQHAGRICVAAIPEVYDTPRIVSIMDDEGEIKLVGINGALVEGQEETYNLAQGRFDVRVTTGAPFATLRQEAAEFYKEITMTNPDLLSTIGDIVFKNVDIPGSQAVSARLRRGIAPQLLGEEGGENAEQQAMAAQMQQMEATIAALQQQLDSKQEEIQAKAQVELQKNETERGKQQLEVEKLRLEAQKLAQDYQLKTQELALEKQELELRYLELRASVQEAPSVDGSDANQRED